MKFKIRLILFILFALVFPVAYFSIRFNLFNSKQVISLWGIIVLVIFLLTVSVMIKYYLDGMKTKYSYLKQVLQGVIKVVFPLLVLVLISVWFTNHLEWLETNMHIFTESCIVLLVTETIAMLVNPLPKWAFENNVDGLVQIANKITGKETE